MLLATLAFIVFAAFGEANASQTSFQIERFRNVSEKACSLAKGKETVSRLVSAFDAPEFRSEIKECCPDIYRLSAPEILRRVKEEMRVVEIVTGFSSYPDTRGSSYAGMNVEEGISGAVLESTWEAMVRHNKSFDGGRGWWSIQDDVETKLYGLKPFSRRGDPQSMNQAKERGVYTLLNTARIASGSPLYGDVTAVLNSSFVRDLALVSAIDTGEWTSLCNSSSFDLHGDPSQEISSWPPAGYNPNCASYNFSSLGTLDCFEHLLLPNSEYWQTSLANQLVRLLAPKWGSVRLKPVQMYTYLEAIPAGDLDFPRSVKFMIGSFPSLFGTHRGENVQKWCKQRGWVLMWTLGLNMGNFSTNFWTAAYIGKDFDSNLRVIDPLVLKHTTAGRNVSDANAGDQRFREMWTAINRTRTVGHITNSTWQNLWTNFSTSMPPSLSVDILSAGDCEDTENCVGTSKTSANCICYA